MLNLVNPLIVALIVFAVILAGAFAGWALGQRLPAHHLNDEKTMFQSRWQWLPRFLRLCLGY